MATEKKNDEQVKDERENGSNVEVPGGERQSPEGFDGTATPDGGLVNKDATPSGEGVDLRVDSPVNPDDKDAPRPTGA